MAAMTLSGTIYCTAELRERYTCVRVCLWVAQFQGRRVCGCEGLAVRFACLHVCVRVCVCVRASLPVNRGKPGGMHSPHYSRP